MMQVDLFLTWIYRKFKVLLSKGSPREFRWLQKYAAGIYFPLEIRIALNTGGTNHLGKGSSIC